MLSLRFVSSSFALGLSLAFRSSSPTEVPDTEEEEDELHCLQEVQVENKDNAGGGETGVTLRPSQEAAEEDAFDS